MSTENITPQTSKADEAIVDAKSIPNENHLAAAPINNTPDENNLVTIRIKTIHEECQGLVDPNGPAPIGIGPKQMDENLKCEAQDQEVNLGPLANITIDGLNEAIEGVIEKGGDHDLEAFVDRIWRSFDFIPEEEGKEVQNLFNISDEELQRVLAGGNGFVQVDNSRDNLLWDNLLWDNLLWDNLLWDNLLWDNLLWD
ncbi:hypothetical protein J7T55_013784 [Diaporthe amygdali]|uniref:uncharacterized protein n=1 Tax=Phomopsis amygdali TaxID=1214568 RepID=UPI0022FE965D|nr:uncharacterized protein J7T55_013784 [Diaporthe amygdali]KAJ0119581.1 hypothetical protein J7T55_013784 [Diaporthe amygdali]